jgi:hypothetical protein
MKLFNISIFSSLFFIVAKTEKIIKNINVNSCRNCIYYKPYSFSGDYTSTLSNCEKFGSKDIITDKISYDYADICRKDETKCGEQGKYFEKELNIELKILKYTIIRYIPSVTLVSFIVLLYILPIIYEKHNVN